MRNPCQMIVEPNPYDPASSGFAERNVEHTFTQANGTVVTTLHGSAVPLPGLAFGADAHPSQGDKP